MNVQLLMRLMEVTLEKMLPKWKLQVLDKRGENKIRSPLMADLTATWYSYSAHSDLDFWNLLFFPAIMQVYEIYPEAIPVCIMCLI